jgi:hypothetical protein
MTAGAGRDGAGRTPAKGEAELGGHRRVEETGRADAAAGPLLRGGDGRMPVRGGAGGSLPQLPAWSGVCCLHGRDGRTPVREGAERCLRGYAEETGGRRRVK